MEENLSQQLEGIAHEPLFKVLLDVQKAYDSLDRGWCMDILRGYGMVHNKACLNTHHWDNLILFPKAKRFLWTHFVTGRGITRGDPVSPMIFNIVVDTVVRATLEVVYGP